MPRYSKSPRYSRRRGSRSRRANRKYRVVGATPDYWVSPIDFVPGGVFYSKGRKAYKMAKRVKNKVKASYKVYKKSKSRRRSRSTSPTGRKRRGNSFYYYRGKRYYGKRK